MLEKTRSIGTGLVEGSIVVIDLDRFGDIVRERGWSEYSPNEATGLLTSLVEDFARKWSGLVVYGLDPVRGTEEAVIEIPLVEPGELREDLEVIREKLNKLGVGVTIVAIRGLVGFKPASSRREAYYGTPDRARALRLLRRVKRRGGNMVYVED